MNKTEIKAIQRRLDNLEKTLGVGRKRKLEDITEALIDIYGMRFLDSLYYGVFERNRKTGKWVDLFPQQLRSIFVRTMLKRQFAGDYSKEVHDRIFLHSMRLTPETTDQEFLEMFFTFMYLHQAAANQKEEPEPQGNDALFDDWDLD